MYQKLMELGNKLKEEGWQEDAELVYSAAFKCIPELTPKYENVTKVPGYGYVHTQQF